MAEGNRPNGGVRTRLLQEELDRRFATVHKEIELRLASSEAMRAYLVAEGGLKAILDAVNAKGGPR
jgi:hypothetical protein